MSAEPAVVERKPRVVPDQAGPEPASFPGITIGVVVPAYCESRLIEKVIRGIPAFVQSIIVVDDASPDDTFARVAALSDPRVTLLRHEANQGVGGAARTGFAEALRQGLDIAVKMDGDDQMDPAYLRRLVEPLVRNEADVVKGNRYSSLASVAEMPSVRIIGNAGLTFLVKLASGYWNQFDPANGYIALRASVLEFLPLQRLPKRFFFESGLLIELGIRQAVVKGVSIPARYGSERSKLSVFGALCSFPPRLLLGLTRRIFWRYFVHDFSAVSVFLLLGVPSILWGTIYGTMVWKYLEARDEFASAGMVMLAAMPIILGFQLILQAVVLDIANVPKAPLSPPLLQAGSGVPRSPQ